MKKLNKKVRMNENTVQAYASCYSGGNLCDTAYNNSLYRQLSAGNMR